MHVQLILVANVQGGPTTEKSMNKAQQSYTEQTHRHSHAPARAPSENKADEEHESLCAFLTFTTVFFKERAP